MTATRVTVKGQVTIPKRVRERFGIRPGDAIEFLESDGRLVVEKKISATPFDKWHGYLKDKVGGKRTDELIREMRGE